MFGLTEVEISAVWLSVKAALISSIIGIPLAVSVGWLFARKNFWGKSFLEGLLHLPLIAPPVVTGFLLLMLLGRNGIAGHWLYDVFGIRVAFTFSAVVIASVIVSIPLALRTIKASFEQVDPSYEKASLTLGASKLKTFFRVSLPLAAPGIVSGFVLIFARSLGEFGATITLAGNIRGKTQTIALAIYSNMQIPGQEIATYRLVIISVIISLAAVAASEYFRKRKIAG